MTTTAPGLTAALAERALHAARAHRTADPDGFHHRHDDADQWNRWARRAGVARAIAAALQVGVDGVLVTDDPRRTYRTRTGPVPGDLITVTDPVTGRAWRFIPDFTAPGDGSLLLDVARCLVTGLQRLMCDLDHDCGRDVWTGWWPGLVDCEQLGWMIGPGLPDLDRLHRGDLGSRTVRLGETHLTRPPEARMTRDHADFYVGTGPDAMCECPSTAARGSGPIRDASTTMPSPRQDRTLICP